jgi:O-antigen/teichoic acid export membrane protein
MGEDRNPVVQFVGRAWDQVKSPLYRNAFFIMLTSVIGNGLGFFFWIIVGRLYQGKVQDPGAAVALFQAIAFLGTIGNVGLGIGLIRFLPETEDKVSLINASLTVSGIASFVLSIGFLLTLPLLLPVFSFVYADESPLRVLLYVLTIIACTIAIGMAPTIDDAAIAMRRADLSTWRNTLFALLKIPLVLIVFFLLLAGRAGVFLSIALSFGLSVAVTGFVLLPRAVPGYRPALEWRLSIIRPVLRFALGNYAATAIGSAAATLPAVMILAALGPSQGPSNAFYFYVALVVASLLYIIPGATFTSFYAEASQKNADHRKDERRAIGLSLLLLIPGIAVMILFSETMLRLFGDPEIATQAVTPLRILTFASIPVFLNGILGTRVRVRKRTLPLIVAAAIVTIITLGLGWVLLSNPDLGIDGLAYAYVFGQAAATPYLYWEARDAYDAIPTEPVFGQPLE